MITENGSIVDSHTIHNLCCHLVCSQIHILFLQSEIVPHHIFCLEQIPVIQIFHLQTHCGKMIAVHNKYHILRIIGKGFRKLFDKIIHFPDLVHIVFPLVILLFCGRSGDSDLRIFQNGFLRVCAMSLYGNGIYIVRSFCRFQAFHDLICQNSVFYPAQGRFFVFLRHIFCRGKGIKAQIGENTFSSIEICFVIMYCMGRIPQIFQDIGRALAGSLLQNAFVGIFPWSEVVHTHSGDGFKLCICSTCAYRGNLKVS